MNMLDHYLVQTYNWNNRRPRRVAEGEFDLNAWDVAPERQESEPAQVFHPGMVSVMMALVVLVMSL